jgi:hypothetical protein
MNGISLARQAVFEALFNVEGKSRFAKQLDSFITWLIVANLLALPRTRRRSDFSTGFPFTYLRPNSCCDFSQPAGIRGTRADASRR